MNTYFKFNFRLFDSDTPAPQQGYIPLNPNWTGQRPGGYDEATGMGGTYTAQQDLSPEMKTFYDKALIRLAEPNLVHDQFGQKRPIPGGNGKTIEFRKFNALPVVPEDLKLLEGITPDGQNYGVSAITATVEQFGNYITISDMLNLTAFDNQMAEITRLLASQAGKLSDMLTRDVLAAGTNVMFASATEGGTPATQRSEITANHILRIADIKKAVRALKRVDCPTINGDYVALIHPDTEYDLKNDKEWIDANQYAGSGRIFSGEIGKMYGVRFVESTVAKIFEVGEGGATVPVYGTLVLGQNAFGVTSINGGGIETIAKQLGSGGTADPLNQRATMGWKLNKVAKILTEEYMIRIEHATSYGESE